MLPVVAALSFRYLRLASFGRCLGAAQKRRRQAAEDSHDDTASTGALIGTNIAGTLAQSDRPASTGLR